MKDRWLEKYLPYGVIALLGIGGIIGLVFLLRRSIKETIEKIKELISPGVEDIYRKYKDLIDKYAEKIYEFRGKKIKVPRSIIAAVIKKESGGDKFAYRYEPVFNIRYNAPYTTDDPIFTGIKMSDVIDWNKKRINIDVSKNKYKIKYSRKLTDWEIKWLSGELKSIKKKWKYYKNFVPDFPKIYANVTRAASFGLMQIMYPTAMRVLGTKKLNPFTLYNPELNISIGTKFLADLYSKYGNWKDALAAYNAGTPASVRGQEYAASVLRFAGIG